MYQCWSFFNWRTWTAVIKGLIFLGIEFLILLLHCSVIMICFCLPSCQVPLSPISGHKLLGKCLSYICSSSTSPWEQGTSHNKCISWELVVAAKNELILCEYLWVLHTSYEKENCAYFFTDECPCSMFVFWGSSLSISFLVLGGQICDHQFLWNLEIWGEGWGWNNSGNSWLDWNWNEPWKIYGGGRCRDAVERRKRSEFSPPYRTFPLWNLFLSHHHLY